MSWLVSKISRDRMDTLAKAYGTDEKTLEIGSFGSPSYAKYFTNRIGIDIRPGPGVDMIADVYNLPFQDNEFDLVLCLGILEHLEDPKKAIVQMKRVLKPNGRILVSVPFMFPIHDAPHDYWRFTKFGLQKLFSDGWQIEKIVAETNTQEFFAVLLQRLGYQSRLRFNKLSKFLLFMSARIIEKIPNMVVQMYGGIQKKISEPEAFTNAFFLVARKD
jgi:SAM-dependent methyltransferase